MSISRDTTLANRSSSSEETKLASSAIKALRELGFECIRINAGKVPIPGGGWSNGARKGTPDWLVVHPYCWLEFKDQEKVAPQQKTWHDWARQCGVPVIVARSVGDAVNFVQKLKRNVVYFERLEIE